MSHQDSAQIEVLIADDEAAARRRVRQLLADVPGAVIVGEARDGLEAVEAIQRARPGLVFLDVQMPGLSGFEVIHAVGADAMPPVIFVTAHDEFAVQAFAVEALDYLVKPVDGPRFSQALSRARRRASELQGRNDLPRAEARRAAYDRLLDSVLPERRYLERLVVRKGERLLFVPIAEVDRFSAEGNYVEVHSSGASHLIRDTLAHIESQLDPAAFVRVHRGEIVARAAIREVEPAAHGDAILTLRGGASLRVSRRYTARLLGRTG